MRVPPDKRRVVQFADWSDIERELWETGLAPVPGRIVRYQTRRRRDATNSIGERAFGRLLGVMRDHGIGHEGLRPSEWINADLMELFIEELTEAKNCNNTIISRVWGVRRAFALMEPNYDSSWMTNPGGVPLRAWLPVEQRRVPLIGVTVLYDWVLEMLERALTISDPVQRALMLRNGLILGVMVARAPRVRSTAAMRLGKNVKVLDGEMWIHFAGDDLKIPGRSLEYRLPPELPPYLTRYINVERKFSLNGQTHDALWVGQNGAPLATIGVAAVVTRATRSRFDRGFGPHRFRKELATALARDYPDNPGLAAAILGISLKVAERYYVQALEEDAVNLIAAHLESERARTRGMAPRDANAW